MKDRIIFITGATSGIGEGCARKFAAMGSDLILNGRNTEKLAELKAELTAKGVDVLTLPFDVRDREAMRAALDSLEGKWKNIDVLVNNAGLVIGLDKEFEGNLDEWDVVLDTNVRALLAMTRMVVPGMVERGRGHIINIGSIAGDAAYPGGSVYLATKAAGQGFVRRTPHRPCRHSPARDEHQAGNGGNEFHRGALSRRQGTRRRFL